MYSKMSHGLIVTLSKDIQHVRLKKDTSLPLLVLNVNSSLSMT